MHFFVKPFNLWCYFFAEETILRAFRTSVGHERNINRASALVRNPSLRRPAENQTEPKKATASKTLPVHVFAISRVFSLKPPMFPPPPPPTFSPPSREIPTFSASPREIPPFAPSPQDLPSVTSSETSSITSDTISEMSVDSSGDCASLMSSEDPCDYDQPNWVKECNGSLQRALSRFSIAAPINPHLSTKRALCTSTPSLFVPDNRKFGLQLLKEQNGNEVVIREVKAGRFSKFNEVKCESVSSRIKKFQSRV